MPRFTLTARQLNPRIMDIWRIASDARVWGRSASVADAAISMYGHAQQLGISVAELADIMAARGVPVSPETAQQVFSLAGQWEAAEAGTGDTGSYEDADPAQGMGDQTAFSDSGNSSGDGQSASLGFGTSGGSSGGSSGVGGGAGTGV